jgi:hypothetical protein
MFSEMLAYSQNTTWYNNLGDHHPCSQLCEILDLTCNMLFTLLWFCCRDASRELVLAHVKEHYQQRLQQASSGGGGGGGGGVGSNDSAEASVRRGHALFRCGHCHQVSNWKHVIQV